MRKLIRVIAMFFDCWRYDTHLTGLKAENDHRVKYLEDIICGEMNEDVRMSEIASILHKRKVEKERFDNLINIWKATPAKIVNP